MDPKTNGKRIFMTGAAGYIGSVITEFAIALGYQVRGLSRSEKGDATLTALGATPVRGDLKTLDVLRAESAEADVVMHLADSFRDFGDSKEYDQVVRIDGAAVDAMAEGLKGTDKPFLVTSGTLVTAPDPNGAETNEESPLEPKPFVARIRSEQYAVSLTKTGVKVIAIRLAPYVYGRGGSGLRLFMSMALASKQAVYVGDGHYQTSTVHVDDAARLYLLAMQQAKAGDIFNATNATDITSRRLAEAMAAALDVPAVSISEEEAGAKFGSFLSKFLTAENRASSAKAVERLGWKPREVGVLEDIMSGSYQRVGQELRETSS